jgi:hypothetical protein
MPIIRTCKAAANPKTSLPVFKWLVIGRRYKPNECLIPKETSSKTPPPTITIIGISF